MTATDDTRRTVEAVWRLEAPRIIGRAGRVLRDFSLAEEVAQDALLAALETWPRDGVPENPAAWLMTATQRRALDRLRYARLAAGKEDEIAHELDFLHETASDAQAEAVDARLDDAIGDDLLRLIFTACHPLLPPEGRAALTLRVMGGLTTDEIARAYLKPEATIAQRIVRAKRTLAAVRIPFEVPRGPELHARLASVLEVIYLIFNEGYAATTGDDWLRPALCDEALRLGRVLAGLMPGESEVFGLVALMEIQASRFAARVSADGEPVLLLDQDRRRWDRLLIRRGLDALAHAESLAGDRGSGPYTLQAGIAACHARAARRPTGGASSPCMMRSTSLPPHRSCASTGRSPWPRRMARPRRSNWLTRCGPIRCCSTITCCRPCAAICSCALNGSTKHAQSSNAPRNSRATAGNGRC